MTFRVLPTMSMPIQFLVKTIYGAKANKPRPPIWVRAAKNISRKLFVGIEAQYGQYNLKDNVMQTFQAFVNRSSMENISASRVVNGIVNFGYASRKKAGTTKDDPKGQVAIYIGMQQVTAKGNILQIPDPAIGNRLTSVYQENKGIYKNPLL